MTKLSRWAKNRADGLCGRCRAQPLPGRAMCGKCLDELRARQLFRTRQRAGDELCPRCGVEVAAGHYYCALHRAENTRQARESRARKKRRR